MESMNISRWGLLLGILSEMSDVERQVVLQGAKPFSFLPDDLLYEWADIFRGGQDLRAIGIAEDVVDVLVEFDVALDDLVDIVPGDADDKEYYIRHDTVWRAVRELADYTLMRIISMSTPSPISFGAN
jgi:hypothetical protein